MLPISTLLSQNKTVATTLKLLVRQYCTEEVRMTFFRTPDEGLPDAQKILCSAKSRTVDSEAKEHATIMNDTFHIERKQARNVLALSLKRLG